MCSMKGRLPAYLDGLENAPDRGQAYAPPPCKVRAPSADIRFADLARLGACANNERAALAPFIQRIWCRYQKGESMYSALSHNTVHEL